MVFGIEGHFLYKSCSSLGNMMNSDYTSSRASMVAVVIRARQLCAVEWVVEASLL